MSLSRRLLIAQFGAGAFASAAAAQQPALASTPRQTEGPFYPVNTEIERDADLTRLLGRSQRASGQIVEMTVRIMDRAGQPLRGARVDLWQANAAGKYDHPGDNNDAPLDPNFQGFARLSAGEDGGVRLITVKPGSYPSGRFMRTSHIHWKISAKGADLTTQSYFPGEPLNERDRILGRLPDPRSVIARPAAGSEPDALAYVWDIVLDV